MTSLLRPRESAAGLTTGEGEWRPRGLRLPSNPRVTVRVKATWRARRSRAARLTLRPCHQLRGCSIGGNT